jgi:hypothetical protein
MDNAYISKMFKTLKCDNDGFIKTMTAINGGVMMPLMDLENKTIIKPTYLTHHKFSVPIDLARLVDEDKDIIYKTCLCYLKLAVKINPAMLEGGISCYKPGALKLDNEYETGIRIWNTKQVGKRTQITLTVAGYKDAITEEIKNPPQ